MKRLIAEGIGTFILVFAGTGAIIANQVSQGTVTHVGVSLTFGLVVMSMIYTLGDLSGAHLNPAVTLAFWRAKRFPAAAVGGYIAAQCLGATAASLVLRLLFPESPTLGATVPAGSSGQSFVMEFLLSAILMFVILNVSTGAREAGVMAGASIGAVIAFEALLGGPISGASMNPARSLGPALVTGRMGELWIYLIAPTLGAMTAVVGCRCVRPEECCRGPCQPGEAS